MIKKLRLLHPLLTGLLTDNTSNLTNFGKEKKSLGDSLNKQKDINTFAIKQNGSTALPEFDVEFVVKLDDVVTHVCDLGQAAPLLIFQVPNMILHMLLLLLFSPCCL